MSHARMSEFMDIGRAKLYESSFIFSFLIHYFMIYYAHKVQNPVFNPLKSEDTPDESISSFTEMPE